MRYFEVGQNDAGQRIDNYLLKILKNVPRSHVYRLLRSGQVRVNKGRIKPAYRLELGDKVRVPPVRQQESESVRPPDDLCDRLVKRIIHEDEDLLVLDKPAGLAVHGGSGLKFGVIEVLRFARSDLDYLELAHRLDRGTSGCLVLAKTRQTLTDLHEGFREGLHDKRYLAVVVGAWQGGEKEISLALQARRLKSGERMVEHSEVGKDAISRFSPVEIWSEASLMEVSIGTGRMHQIRVHAAEAGHPVAGDDKYADASTRDCLRKYGLRRMFLHAHAIKLILPKRTVEVSCELPPELMLVLEKLKEPT